MCLQGGPKPLGRAFAEPEFKTVDQYYKKPRLEFFDINKGRARAGELLATFELIELDYSQFGEVTLISHSINPCISFNLDIIFTLHFTISSRQIHSLSV